MPGLVRVDLDSNVTHPCIGDNPPHSGTYSSGSSNVYCNGKKAVRIGDSISCGDVAAQGSGVVFINGLPAHRQGDKTTGHDCWIPTTDNVIID
jgi:uncharacterized Zn-binding protein involved in type VI secretion